jgi:DNA-binding protein HU-beta
VTKSEFVDQVADRSGLSKKQATDAVDAVISTLEDTLKRGSEVTFTGFGKFHVAQRGARQGVHPQTKQPIQIPASRVPRFSPGSGLKRAVNS